MPAPLSDSSGRRYGAHLEFDNSVSLNQELLLAGDFEQLLTEGDVLRVLVHFLE